MVYCFYDFSSFLRRTFLSTTLNEFLYRVLAASLIAFGVRGAGGIFNWPFMLVIPFILLTSAAETLERWLSVPHTTLVSVTTLLMSLPVPIFRSLFQESVQVLINTGTLLPNISIYIVPFLVATYSGALVTFSDVWKVKLSISIILAILPTVVEVVVFSSLRLLSGESFIWGLVTALCLCAADHGHVLRRAALMENAGAGLRYDMPQLMRSSTTINLIVVLFAATVAAQFSYPCFTMLTDNGTWMENSTNCVADFFSSSDSSSLFMTQIMYGLSLACGLVFSGLLFVFARCTGIPKTHMLSIVVLSAVPIFFHAFPLEFTSEDPPQANPFYLIHGAEPFICFFAAVILIYGWKKNARFVNAPQNVKQNRINAKVLLYASNVGLYCYLGFNLLVFFISDDATFFASLNKLVPISSIHLPDLFASRTVRLDYLAVTVMASMCAAVAKCLTVVLILKWRYRTNTRLAFYFGTVSTAKGVISSALITFVFLKQMGRPEFAQIINDTGINYLQIANPTQMKRSVNMIISLLVANLAVNPLAVFVSSILSERWTRVNSRYMDEVEMN